MEIFRLVTVAGPVGRSFSIENGTVHFRANLEHFPLPCLSGVLPRNLLKFLHTDKLKRTVWFVAPALISRFGWPLRSAGSL